MQFLVLLAFLNPLFSEQVLGKDGYNLLLAMETAPIRCSSLPPWEKGQALLKFVHEGMSADQVEAVLGHWDTFVGIGAFGPHFLCYIDYQITVVLTCGRVVEKDQEPERPPFIFCPG